MINANNSNSQQTIEQARQLRQEFDQLDNNISQFMSSSYFSPERRQQRRQQSQERISQRRSGAQRRPRATKNIYTGLPETPMQGSLQRDLRGPINNQPEAPVQGPLQSELAEPMVNQPEAPIQGPLQSELAEPIVNQPEGPMQGPLGSELQEPQPNFNDETQQRAREARLENWLDRHSDSVDISSNQSIFDNIRSVSYPELKQRYRQQYDAYRPILKNMIDAYKKDWESGASTPEQRREWLARLRSGEIFDQIAQQSGS